MADTNYIVLEKQGQDTIFRVVGHANAATPKGAIENVVDKLVQSDGVPEDETFNSTFAAVPVRNWSEFPVGLETRIKVG